jgi:hypothetical protein
MPHADATPPAPIPFLPPPNAGFHAISARMYSPYLLYNLILLLKVWWFGLFYN